MRRESTRSRCTEAGPHETSRLDLCASQPFRQSVLLSDPKSLLNCANRVDQVPLVERRWGSALFVIAGELRCLRQVTQYRIVPALTPYWA